ncbi:metallophosphoesterase [Actinospica sp. MGRD01-02]|uniref:Metallophosphoesterase n=1 Tax=Actinospica acidithermotolerans TaxID=2828514 RepID=A0A941EGH4_9ACTN|nr:metallophosphoesterase [Actinospica acidithermotolerans]MBR7829968.1 metallophosphoesterase [Actinospica acidithermotolerans]
MPGTLFAVSDVHVAYAENREHVESLRPESAEDWLIVAGDVAERFTDVARALHSLRSRFEKVIWVPGNHELWTPKTDPVQSRGVERYNQLVELCRKLDVLTPEDPYAVWDGEGGPVVVAPLFLLYDYSFHPPGTRTKEAGLAYAYETGVVCADEALLHPDPYATREEWCAARIEETERRLAERPEGLPTVLVNHFPLTREPTRKLRYPEFAQWCGTTRTADWHLRYAAKAVVYGHLHIPRTTWEDGVRFEEVSLGYPREWQPRGGPSGLRRILPG